MLKDLMQKKGNINEQLGGFSRKEETTKKSQMVMLLMFKNNIRYEFSWWAYWKTGQVTEQTVNLKKDQ